MSHTRKILYLAGFLFTLPVALMAYINSSFISSFVSEKLVGMIYTAGSATAIIGLILAPKIWRKLGGYKFLLSVTIIDALTIILFAFSKNAFSAAIFFVLGFTLNILIFSSLDELLKIYSQESAIGKTRGLYLSLCSMAWIIAQLLLGTFLGEYSFRTIYIISFLIMTVFLVVSFYCLRNIQDPKYDKKNTKIYLGEFLRSKNLFRAYGMNLLLQFFYSWMVIYTPIYLSFYLGFSWKEIGIIFAIMLLPFFLIPFPLGKYTDRIGERKILMWGFAIAGIATLSLFFIGMHEIWIWALSLFTTRIGAASVETAADSYFFKHIRPEQDEFIDVYRSALPISYIIGPLLASVVLYFVPAFNFIYLILGAFMLYGIYLSSRIRRGDI
ncbi:MFS transporter [Candidatus Nomurabacteria bacterium]|nr:MFS transporter [Candidatus Nomurabacteria bacterium]